MSKPLLPDPRKPPASTARAAQNRQQVARTHGRQPQHRRLARARIQPHPGVSRSLSAAGLQSRRFQYHAPKRWHRSSRPRGKRRDRWSGTHRPEAMPLVPPRRDLKGQIPDRSATETPDRHHHPAPQSSPEPAPRCPKPKRRQTARSLARRSWWSPTLRLWWTKDRPKRRLSPPLCQGCAQTHAGHQCPTSW